MPVTPKETRVFTRDDPCTKVHLHNCFCQGGKFVPRAVVEARGEIGVNAIKYLLREELATATTKAGVDYWTLTAAGQAWLVKGLARYLELHPEQASLVNVRQSSSGKVLRRARRR